MYRSTLTLNAPSSWCTVDYSVCPMLREPSRDSNAGEAGHGKLAGSAARDTNMQSMHACIWRVLGCERERVCTRELCFLCTRHRPRFAHHLPASCGGLPDARDSMTTPRVCFVAFVNDPVFAGCDVAPVDGSAYIA